MTRRPDAAGGLLLAVFTFGWAGLLGLLAAFTVLLVVGEALLRTGADPAALAALGDELARDPTSVMRPWLLAVTMAVQFPAMLALAPLSWVVVDALWYRARGVVSPRGPWRTVLGLAPAPAWGYGLALVAGLTVGLLPGWFATVAREALPSLAGGTLDLIDGAFRTGPLGWRLLLAFDIAILAPVVEELVFRGFVWDAMRRAVPLWLTWLLSSFLFCAYHMDPLQSLAIVPTALLLGWVRWTTGSVVPAIVVHAANNGLGVAVAWAGAAGGPEVTPSVGLAVGGGAVTLGLAAGLARLRAARDPAFDDSPLVGAR